MPTARSNSRPHPRSNPGPAAAARNRAALLESAHAVFAESGTAAPLSSIARRAGVGQGSLYRHFPDRVSLIAAVVEENVDALEAAADAGAALPALLGLVTRHAIESVGVVDLLAEDRPARMLELRERVATVLAARHGAALEAGQVPPGTTVEDLMLGVELVAGALTRRPAADRAPTAARAWKLLGIEVALP